MNIDDLLVTESKGIFGRQSGDTFTADNGNKLRFVDAAIYPDAQKGVFTSPEEMEATKAQIENQFGVQIQWVNKFAPRNKAFAIAQLVDDSGDTTLWGRYYDRTPGVLTSTWKNTETPNKAWSYGSKAAGERVAGAVRNKLAKQGKLEEDTVEEGMEQLVQRIGGIARKAKKIGGKALDTLGHGSDEDL